MLSSRAITGWVCQSCRHASRRAVPVMARQTNARSNSTLPSVPTFAPKPLLDISSIRKNPELYAQNAKSRNYPLESTFPSKIITLSEEQSSIQDRVSENRTQLRKYEALFKVRGKDGKTEGIPDLHAKMRSLRTILNEGDKRITEIEKQKTALALQIPNLTHSSTPTGDHPQHLRYINPHLLPPWLLDRDLQKPTKAGTSHTDIGTELSLLDLSSPSTTSGWGFYFLLNSAVLLEQALISHALSLAISHGWTPVAPPSMVYSHIASACGYRPRDHNDEQQIYTIPADVKSGSQETVGAEICMAGTSEILLAGMMAGSTSEQADYERPKKYVGISRCYRAEAGSRGTAAKGLYRVHEFTKVELFSWCLPDQSVSDGLYEEIIELQEKFLTSLDLPCRVLQMPTTDLGASATRKVDIEAFMPSRINVRDTNGWGEVTSVSECGDYQARRLGVRYKKPDGKIGFLWSLNGTAVAVPRVLLALLENGWDEEGRRVRVPEVLRGYMGGREWIEKV